MKNTSEQLLSFAEDELMQKESIRRAVLRTQPERQKKPVAWTKILLPIAACFVILCGTVLLIPSARAEVFSWFGVSRPADYLTTDPSERPDVPDLDALIASPDANEEVVTIPIDRTDSEAVNSEGAMKVSAFLHENCDVALGEAMFDGESLYQTIRLNGLSGLYLLEHWTGSRTMGVPVDPYAVWGLYEGGPGEEYLSGEKTLYEMPESWIMYEMPDGKRFGGMIDLTSSIEKHLDRLHDLGLLVENKTEEQMQAIDAENRAYLMQNGLMASAEIFPHDYEQYLDADGNLTAKVYYVVSVIEEDRGDGSYVPDTELYNAQIGTITVNMKAYQNVSSNGLEASAPVVWDAETVVVSKIDIDFGDPDDRYEDDRVSLYKQRVSTEGLTMTADTEGAEFSTLGLKNIKIRITVPESWTREDREALADSLTFKVLLNGESGDWFANPYNCEAKDDGTLAYELSEIVNVPYELMGSIRTITFVPVIRSVDTMDVFHQYDNGTKSNPLGTMNPEYGVTEWSAPGVNSWNYESTTTEFPQYAVTLNVK